MVIGCEHGRRQMHAGVRLDDSGRASGSPQAVSRMAWRIGTGFRTLGLGPDLTGPAAPRHAAFQQGRKRS